MPQYCECCDEKIATMQEQRWVNLADEPAVVCVECFQLPTEEKAKRMTASSRQFPGRDSLIFLGIPIVADDGIPSGEIRYILGEIE